MRSLLPLCGCALLLAGTAHGADGEEPKEKQAPTLLELFIQAPIVATGVLKGGGDDKLTAKFETVLKGDLKPGSHTLHSDQVPAMLRFGSRKLSGYTLFLRHRPEGDLEMLAYQTPRGVQPAFVNLGGAAGLMLRAAKDPEKTLKDKNQIARNAAAIYLARAFVREHGPRRLPPEEVFGGLLRACDSRHSSSANGPAGRTLIEEAQAVLREMGLEEALAPLPGPRVLTRTSVRSRGCPGDWVKTMRGRIFAARDGEAELRAAGGWKARLASAVRDLAHEDFDAREKAEAELAAVGRLALKALREAAKSSDREVRERAGRVLEELEPMERYGWLARPKAEAGAKDIKDRADDAAKGGAES